MIEIYTKPNCTYCVYAKNYLKTKNISFMEYKLDVDFIKEDIKEKYPEAKTYPVVVVDNKYIGGFVDLKNRLELNVQYLDGGAWNGS